MTSVQELLCLSASLLREKGLDSPKRVAEELLAYQLHLKWADLPLHRNRSLGGEELASHRVLLERLCAKEPLQYVLGEVEFGGCRIRVDRRALIPRPETELLVELVLEKSQGKILWDLCTGSGCIGIALKKRRSALVVSLSDLSFEALALATENAALNRVELELCLGDLFAPFAGRRADCIVCNPPYVSMMEYPALDPSIRNFEPAMALLGGERGVEFYERLAVEAPPFLNPGGLLLVEIGSEQGEAVLSLFSRSPWSRRELIPDWTGRSRFLSVSI